MADSSARSDDDDDVGKTLDSDAGRDVGEDEQPRLSLREQLLSEDMRVRYREQTLASIGGWSGTVVAAIPTVVFVAVNIAASLRTAVLSAVAAAAMLAVYRLIRREPLAQAGAGLVGVLFAALIANATGQARDYFLVGILTSFAYGLAFAVSMVVKRPLVGLMWEFLDPITTHPEVTAEGGDGPDDTGTRTHTPWFRRHELRRAYQLATAGGVVVFFGRGAVQLMLYLSKETTWLGVARVVMGYPLWLAALLFAFWIVRRTRHKLIAPPPPPA